MRLRESLEAVAELSPGAFEDLRRDIAPEWVLQSLEATGTATLRTRRLPAEQVVWLVIGMALPPYPTGIGASPELARWQHRED